MNNATPPNATIKTSGVEAVDRALNILTAFREDDSPLNLSELSYRTGYYKSTILRMLVSLENAGFISRRPDKTFAIGPQIMRLSGVYQRMFRLEDHVRPVLRQLVATTRESATFFRIEGRERICLFRENSNQGLRDHVHEGETFPLNKGAAGHVLIRFRTVRADSIPARLARSLPIVSHGEMERGTSGAAVPVFQKDGTLCGALALSGPQSRLTLEMLSRYKPLLLRAGKSISQSLGAP